MAEKEFKVTPIIRLPQIRAVKDTQPGRGPESSLESGFGVPDGRGLETEEMPEDEGTPPPLQTQISGDQAYVSSDSSGLHSGVSSLLRRALLNFAEQERQRARLVTILLVAQAAILLAVLPGYLFGRFQLAGTLVVLGGLVLFGIVWLLNWMGRIAEASYLLVIGGGALVVLDLLLSAAHLLSLETLHIALLFLLVILTSGILFSPETAVILAIIFALFTAIVLLVFHPSTALATLFTPQGRYLSVAYLVMVQLGVGAVAWLFGRQMQESVHLVTYVAGLQMSNKRLHKRLREIAEQKRHLEAGIAMIQQTHARVAAGDYAARAHVEGDLLPLAVSLNLMLERVESLVHGEHERERMETAVAGLAELAGRVGQESMGRLPVPTGTAIDGLSIAIKQMQTSVNQRLARVQQSVAALMTTVGRCQGNLLPVAEVLEEHLRSIDALVLAADNVMNSAQRQVDFAAQAEKLLLAAAPAGIDLKAGEDDSKWSIGTSALRLAEEMERSAAAQARLDEPAPALAESAAALAGLAATQGQAFPEVEMLSASEATVSLEGQAAAMPADQPEASVEEVARTDEANDQPVTVGHQEGEHRADAQEADISGAENVANDGELQSLAASEISDQVDVPSAPVVDTFFEQALADTDDETTEEANVPEARPETDWNLEQLRELAGVLAMMANEATHEERNARTLTYKLRAMLQGMPNTRQVDMMAAWLRTALEAITQSANQVQEASKTIPSSAFHPATRDGGSLQVED